MRKIRSLIRNYQEVIIPFVLLAIAALGIFLGVLPAGQRTLGFWGQVNDTENSVAQLRSKDALLSSLNETDLQQQLVTIVSAIPADKAIPTIFLTLDQLSAQTGVTVTDMTLTSPGSLATEAAKRQTTEEKALGASLIPFAVTVEGPLSAVSEFLSQVTWVRRLLRLRNFDLSLTGPDRVTLRLGLDAFFVPLPTLSARVEQPLPVLTTEENATLTKLSAYPWLSRGTGQAYGAGPGKQNPFAR